MPTMDQPPTLHERPTAPPTAPAPIPDEEDDDRLIGRLLSRREVIRITGGLGAAAFLAACTSAAATPIASAVATATGASATPGATGTAAAATTATSSAAASASATALASAPSCVATPQVTEGPYFVDEKLNRTDIRTDATTGTAREGAAFVLAFVISRISGGACTAWEGAVVDVWHCDGVGQYSDVSDQGFNTKGQNWLRGYQTTDATGVATFTTIVPGWYSGRAVHIHFKVRTSPGATSGLEFTSQLFFDEAQLSAVYAVAPYAAHGTTPDRSNSADDIYNQTGGQTLLTLAQAGDGYAATIGIGIQA
jgi:protocatechuate 3,4-dioxygenase beta subunit